MKGCADAVPAAAAGQSLNLEERYEKKPNCRKVIKLTQYLKGQYGANEFCQSYLGIKCKTKTKVMGTKTVTRRVNITKTITGDNIQITPDPSTDVFTTTVTDTITHMITTTPTTTKTTTTTIMVSEGIEGAPTAPAKRDLEARYGDYSFNRMLKKVVHHPRASISAACSCISPKASTKTVSIRKTTTQTITSTATTSISGTTTTLSVPFTKTITTTESVSTTVTNIETASTVTVAATATSTLVLPQRCFRSNIIGYEMALFLGVAIIRTYPEYNYEWCCYHCWKGMVDCLHFSLEEGVCKIWEGAHLQANYIEVDEQCPHGVYPGSRMEFPGKDKIRNSDVVHGVVVWGQAHAILMVFSRSQARTRTLKNERLVVYLTRAQLSGDEKTSTLNSNYRIRDRGPRANLIDRTVD
ncbi:hypothetical protein K440DRAFT_636071 [Wilcoxina mikolae CBS 423.85]|nr:hypothetical protein K440DRAFT_636071 [Wilcoxina mikolae CBS 423.85]